MPRPLADYELLRCIGTGGMAEVHLARMLHEDPSQSPVVVKRMLPHLRMRPEFVQMFMDEARVSSRLIHPNLVRVHDWGNEGGVPYMVMEYVDGPHLGDLVAHFLRRDERLPIRIAVHIISRACRGLHHAHGATDEFGRKLGIVHRDVSPQNIMVSQAGEVKVLDFGVAKTVLQSTLTHAGVLKGKLGYIAPEQCTNHSVDRRADVYAAGVTLHELLTGSRLFAATNPLLVIRRIVQEEVPLPSALNPLVPPDLDEIVMHAMARDPDERVQDAQTLADMLDAFLETRGQRIDAEELGNWLVDQAPALFSRHRPEVDEEWEVGSMDLVHEDLPTARLRPGGAPTPFSEVETLPDDEPDAPPPPPPSALSRVLTGRLAERRMPPRDGFYARLFAAANEPVTLLGAEQVRLTREFITGDTTRPLAGQWIPFLLISALDPLLDAVERAGGRVIQGRTFAENGVFAIIEDSERELLGLFSASTDAMHS